MTYLRVRPVEAMGRQGVYSNGAWVALFQVEAAISNFNGRWDIPMITGEREWS